MTSATFPHILLPLIVAVSILLMLIRPRNIPEVYWVGGGALLLIIFRLIPLQLAGRAAARGSDVYFFLIGMMLLSELAREQGVFDWLSSAAVKGRTVPAFIFSLWFTEWARWSPSSCRTMPPPSS